MLQNKKILIAGLANKHSIAAGIARAMHAQGAELAFTYQSERLKGNVEKIASELGSNLLFECDVASDESIDIMFKKLSNHWESFDGFVHSIGYAPANELEGNFVDAATREGFQIAHDISSYSFTAMAKAAGATDEEIKTAVAIAADVALNSSMLYGNQFDMNEFLQMFSQ